MTDFVGITVFQHTPQCAENPVLFNNPGNYLNPPAKPGAARLTTAAKIATPHNPAIIYKPGDGVVSSGLAYVAVRACQAVVC